MKPVIIEIPNTFLLLEQHKRKKMQMLSDDEEIKDYQDNIIRKSKLRRIKNG